jgi:peptide-methionine (R)-S-oxide reductase
VSLCVENNKWIKNRKGKSKMNDDISKKSDSYWKEKLSPESYAVTREAATERPFTGKYNDFFEGGDYHCICCNQFLFKSDTKFESGCGWPAFFESIEDSIEYKEDLSHGMKRVEVLCSNCGAHLGHVFEDGPPPTGKRYCINSVAIQFKKNE